MNKQRLEGILEKITTLETFIAYELPQGTGERRYTFTGVTITGRDGKLSEIRFNGIILSDSIGHSITYTESVRLWTDESKEYIQELFDSELGRHYTANYRVKPTTEDRDTQDFMFGQV